MITSILQKKPSVNADTKTVTVEKESSEIDQLKNRPTLSPDETYADVRKKLFQSDEEESVSTTLMTQPTDNYQSKDEKKTTVVPKQVIAPDSDADSVVANDEDFSDTSCEHLSDDDDIKYKNNHQLYVIDWYKEVMLSSQDSETIAKDLKRRCWVTNDLSEEIRKHYPTEDEVIINRSIGNVTRDMSAFQNKCVVVFPKGRVSLSYQQVQQTAKHFLTGWNCKKVVGECL